MPTGETKRGLITADPGRVTYTFVALGVLLEKAYDLKSYQVAGPDWIKSQRYDIVATLPPGSTEKQIQVMLRNLLTERFKIELHREQKPLPVYELTVAKNAFKGKPAEHADIRISFGGKGRKLTGADSMSGLAATLTNMLDRPVLDATGIQGTYDLNLEWTPDEREAGSVIAMKARIAATYGGPPEGGDNPNGPSLSTVLQADLGLKLEPKKTGVDTLVIDKAERVPTQN